VTISRSFNAIVIGAGIAGLSVADAVLLKGLSCAVIDKGSAGSGSSGAPGMLINPATGRRAKMSWKAKEAIQSVYDLLDRVHDFSSEIFFEKNGVIRPAPYSEIGSDFKRSPEKYDWPDGWIEWLNEDSFSSQFPAFQNHYGGLIIKKGATVNGNRYMKLLSGYLCNQGLVTRYNNSVRYVKNEAGWEITLTDGEKLQTDHLIFATGSSLVQDPIWEFLSLNLIKGQTASFQFKEPLPIRHSVSSLGYLAYMSTSPGTLVTGSTYEHKFESKAPDQKGLNFLKEKLNKTLPGWAAKISHTDQWAGIRVSSKDKKPVAGEHPELKGLYVIGALGSKGLLHGRFVAQQLADSIFDYKLINPLISVNRFV
jgi:glycine oxidase